MIADVLQIGGAQIPVTWRRNARARRYILRYQHPTGVIATIPRGGSQREAFAFLQRSQAWLERQLAKPIPATAIFGAGTEIWFRGQKMALELSEHFAKLGSEIFPINGDLKLSVQFHFQELAGNELIPRTRELAAQTETEIRKITIRNQRSRWGSCSLRRTISLNWRLIQTPQFVVDYIILHELMHLRQMNHSPRFWAEVEKVCPTWREAESWLRRHGREIMSA